MSDNNSGNVVLGTLLGAAVGFAAGILLAPASGKETRDNLNEKASELKGSLSEATDKALSTINEVKESAQRTVREEADKVKKQTKS